MFFFSEARSTVPAPFSGAIKNPFSLGGEEAAGALLIFPEPTYGSGWNWHLVIEVALQPVAVASSGQSLDHSQ